MIGPGANGKGPGQLDERTVSRIAYFIRNHTAIVAAAIASPTSVSHAGPPDRVSLPLDLFAKRFNYGSQEGWDWRQKMADPLTEAQREWFASLPPRLRETSGDLAADESRAWMATDWLLRTYAPTWLRKAGFGEQGATLEQLPEIVSVDLALSALPAVMSADALVIAAAAGGVVRTTAPAPSAMCMAAGGASYSSIRSSLAMAALAVGNAACDIASSAARQVILDASGPNGPADHWAPEEAEDAVKVPTRKELQISALDHFGKMIDVGRAVVPALRPRAAQASSSTDMLPTEIPNPDQALHAMLRQAISVAAAEASRPPMPSPTTLSPTAGFEHKTWHEWQPNGADPGSVLAEIARHMRNAWVYRANTGDTHFKAGWQLAHKGWKFGGGLIDLADGAGVPGINAVRALIIAGRQDWFEQAAAAAPGQMSTVFDAPSLAERNYLANLCGPGATLNRIRVNGAEIWMVPQSDGWRVAAVFVRDASASGLKQVMQLAVATGGGCLRVAATTLVIWTLAATVILGHVSA